MNPFDTLPNELLLAVFRIAEPAQYHSDWSAEVFEGRSPFPVVISSVCRRWRNLVISSSELWSSIYINDSRTLHFASLFLERSQPQTVDLSVSNWDYSSPPETLTTKIAQLLAKNIGRAHSLNLDSFHLELYPRALFELTAPSLHTFKLQVRVEQCGWPHDKLASHPPLIKEAESLRSISLKGVCSRRCPPLSNLSHIEIHKFSPTFTEFRNLFATSPSLHTLCLPTFMPSEKFDEEFHPIDASSLRSFSVGLGIHTDASSCRCMLTFLRMDNLEYLEIAGDLRFPVSKHFSQSNGLQNVHTLRLHNMSVNLEDIELWSALNSVSRIELDCTDNFGKLLDLGAAPTPTIYFPRLSSLLYDENMYDSLVDLLCSRRQSGFSRVEIPLDDDSQPMPHSGSMATKFAVAGIELIFVDHKEFRGLAHYISDSDEDELSDDEDDYYSDHDYDYDHDYDSEEEDYFDDEDFGDDYPWADL